MQLFRPSLNNLIDVSSLGTPVKQARPELPTGLGPGGAVRHPSPQGTTTKPKDDSSGKLLGTRVIVIPL